MDSSTKLTSYEAFIQEYDRLLKSGRYLFSDDGSGDGSDYETWDDDDDYCNEANCC